MRPLEQLLTQYAAYHRDRRNLKTHFLGVPMIVFAVILALAQVIVGPVHLAWVAMLLASVYYLLLDRPLGLALVVYLCANVVLASVISALSNTTTALVLAAILFIGGWIIQFVGHHYEGVKPAFLDDISGLYVSPIFLMAEVAFALGQKRRLKDYIEARVGPTLAARNGAPISPRSGVPS